MDIMTLPALHYKMFTCTGQGYYCLTFHFITKMREAASIHTGAFSNYLSSFFRVEFVGRRDFRNCSCALMTILSTHRAKFEHGVEKEKENAQKAAGLSSIFVPIRKKVSPMGE